MAFRRYRRYRRRVPRVRRRFRGAALRKVKKDILKCNFPTKVKFIGLPEKKVMFLTEQEVINTKNNNGTLYLYPTRCKNIRTLCKLSTLDSNGPSGSRDRKAIISNWDKYCVLAVYIRIQPLVNMFDGSEGGKTIVPVKCFYSMNNNVIFKGESDDERTANIQLVKEYNEQMLVEKPLFTFNSNEHFTFVLRAPQTMQTDTPVIHKRYTWWSLVDQAIIELGNTNFSGGKYSGNSMMEEIEPEESEFLPFSTPLVNFRSAELPAVHCGHLFFTTEDGTEVALNATINYKIALKG